MNYSRIIDAATIAEALGGNRSGQGWRAPCPVREHSSDKRPFAIKDGHDGRPLIYCHAGCAFEDIVSELKSRGLWPKMDQRQVRLYKQQRKSRVTNTQLFYAHTFVQLLKNDLESGRIISTEDKIILKKCMRFLKAKGGHHAS